MKMKALIVSAMVLAAMTATAWAGEVSQGRYIGMEAASAQMTIEEYDTNFTAAYPYGTPTGIITRFDVSTAKIGIHPEAGDILRIAYDEKGDTKRAIKVMNVSKQDLRKK